MKQKTIKFSTLFFLLMLPFSLWAAASTGAYPTTFANTGHIDRIDAAAGEIVINDTLISLPSSATVHRPSRKFSSSRDLKKGMKVGYSSHTENGKKTISELWLLPKNWGLSESESESELMYEH